MTKIKIKDRKKAPGQRIIFTLIENKIGKRREKFTQHYIEIIQSILIAEIIFL